MGLIYSGIREIVGCMRLCSVDYIILISGLANQVIQWVLPIYTVTMMYGIIELQPYQYQSLRQYCLEDFGGLGQLEEMGPLCDTIDYTISMYQRYQGA